MSRSEPSHLVFGLSFQMNKFEFYLMASPITLDGIEQQFFPVIFSSSTKQIVQLFASLHFTIPLNSTITGVSELLSISVYLNAVWPRHETCESFCVILLQVMTGVTANLL